jgi:hypothetical protein
MIGLNLKSQGKPGIPKSQEKLSTSQNWIEDLERRMIKGSETPAWRKVEKSGLWIKDLMNHLDSIIDRETRIRLMQECGRSCFIRAFGVADNRKPSPAAVKENLGLLEKRGYKMKRKGSTVSFNFNWGRNHQNPWGLILHDGYCMCPIVESSPARLSSTFCNCSTGYVKESFERTIGKPVTVELLDSLKMGGKDCLFKVTVQDI